MKLTKKWDLICPLRRMDTLEVDVGDVMWTKLRIEFGEQIAKEIEAIKVPLGPSVITNLAAVTIGQEFVKVAAAIARGKNE